MIRKFQREGSPLMAVSESGHGRNVCVFQHGLCGDAAQTAEVFPDEAGFRRVTLECRGHGESEAGNPEEFSIATFADDVATLIETEALAPCVVGGISMGAAIALRLAVNRSQLVRGLVLGRPAWVVESGPANMAGPALAGKLLAQNTAEIARRRFEETSEAAELAVSGPDNLASIRGFFSREPLNVTAALLSSISADGPGVTEAQVAGIKVPTLVIANRVDAVHPLAHARRLAGLISGADFVEIASKAKDRERHVAEFREALREFLAERCG